MYHLTFYQKPNTIQKRTTFILSFFRDLRKRYNKKCYELNILMIEKRFALNTISFPNLNILRDLATFYAKVCSLITSLKSYQRFWDNDLWWRALFFNNLDHQQIQRKITGKTQLILLRNVENLAEKDPIEKKYQNWQTQENIKYHPFHVIYRMSSGFIEPKTRI